MKLYHLASLVAGLSFVTAQTDTDVPTVTDFPTATGTRTATDTSAIVSETAAITNSAVIAPTNVPTSEACAVVSSRLAEQSGPPYLVNADLANQCQLSVPIVQQDALDLIDGIVAALEFQSDVGHLANPPEGYLLAGVDLFGEIQQIRDDVNSGSYTSEIEFERNMSAVLGKAQDGHLNFKFDGIAPFLYQRQFSLVSVSSDGKELPKLYLQDELLEYLSGSSNLAPSAVTQINGEDPVDFLQRDGQNVSYGLLQDPDALYNGELYVLNSGSGGVDFVGGFALSSNYQGSNTTLTLADGSTRSAPNVAGWNTNYDFTGMIDGASYYNMFCNATYKYELYYGGSSGSSSSNKLRERHLEQREEIERSRRHRVDDDLVKRQIRFEKRQVSSSVSLVTTSAYATATGSPSTSVTQIPGYPSPVALSSDLTLSGYFLSDPGFEDTAVLVLQAMSEDDPQDFQSQMTSFLDQCRSAGKKRLVIDVQGNPGGSVGTGYDTFMQLFPDLFPYGAGTLRAQEGLDTLGTFYTNYTEQVYQEAKGNITLLAANNYYAQYNAKAYANDSGQLFESWPELYGPVDSGTDNFTNLIRWDVNSTDFNIGTTGLVISGLGNDTGIPPSPFTSDNIIVLADGRCSSTCTILTHFLKYQAKVKSIAMGGRPQTGAMQAVGGVKGSQVYQYLMLYGDVSLALQQADALGYTDQVDAINSSKILGNILNSGDYIALRGANAGVQPTATNDFTFNFQNNIAEGDTSLTPLQFVYEAADCRLWYQPQHYGNISTLWATAAAQAFGLNNTQVFSLCVEGSTNASSSLSGNATLYNGGKPTNVTDFQAEGSGGGGGNDNGVGRMTASSMVIVSAVAAAVIML